MRKDRPVALGTAPNQSAIERRLAIVRAHIAAENAHDAPATVATWGSAAPCFFDAAAGLVATTPREIGTVYDELFDAFPDLRIDWNAHFVAQDVIIVETTMTGTHQNEWRGIAATHMYMSLPLCALFYFSANDELICEKIYYDRLTLLEQLGIVAPG